MSEVSHTHPHASRGAVNRPFERGPVVAADGGKREARDRDDTEDEETEAEAKRAEEEEKARAARKQMKDVDHTPPHGDGVDRVFERGGKEEPVQGEE